MLCVFLNIVSLIYLDIAKPRLQKILPILFALDDIISQFQETKLCALPFIVNWYMQKKKKNTQSMEQLKNLWCLH